ncbi:MAG: hypothetical protein M3Q19_07750 [Pseudomonadota bacterium]|nr:hypothetical protein [Pseudomonadota bacterium]
MRTLHFLVVGAALAGLLAIGAGEAGAQQRVVQSGGPITPLSHGGHFRGSQIVPISNGGHFRGGHFRRGRHGGHFGGGHFGGGKFHGFPGIFVVERQVPVIIEREVVVREVAPAPPPAPSPEGEGMRKPYVVGRSYASLPGGCMKMIEGGASYYWCSGGEWYRLVGKQYRAVARP